MMLGALLLHLRATGAGSMPVHAGRLLHAALFCMLRDKAPALSTVLHDDMQRKPFTVSDLIGMHAQPPARGHRRVRAGDTYRWRITALDTEVLHILMELRVGDTLRVGAVDYIIDEIVADRAVSDEVGTVDAKDLVAACMAQENVGELTLEFRSPVSFRSFTDDYPFPLPELIFTSLADKWRQIETSFDIDRDALRERAASLVPRRWSGESRTVFLEKQRGVTGFIGSFTFSLHRLAEEERGIFLLLAQFAFFSGVGRLTAQGLGQTHCKFG